MPGTTGPAPTGPSVSVVRGSATSDNSSFLSPPARPTRPQVGGITKPWLPLVSWLREVGLLRRLIASSSLMNAGT